MPMPISKIERQRLKELGERVKQLRMSKGLSLSMLADKIGKEPQSISRLEVGQVNPSYIYLLQLSEGLDIPISQLLSE